MLYQLSYTRAGVQLSRLGGLGGYEDLADLVEGAQDLRPHRARGG